MSEQTPPGSIITDEIEPIRRFGNFLQRYAWRVETSYLSDPGQVLVHQLDSMSAPELLQLAEDTSVVAEEAGQYDDEDYTLYGLTTAYDPANMRILDGSVYGHACTIDSVQRVIGRLLTDGLGDVLDLLEDNGVSLLFSDDIDADENKDNVFELFKSLEMDVPELRSVNELPDPTIAPDAQIAGRPEYNFFDALDVLGFGPTMLLEPEWHASFDTDEELTRFRANFFGRLVAFAQYALDKEELTLTKAVVDSYADEELIRLAEMLRITVDPALCNSPEVFRVLDHSTLELNDGIVSAKIADRESLASYWQENHGGLDFNKTFTEWWEHETATFHDDESQIILDALTGRYFHY